MTRSGTVWESDQKVTQSMPRPSGSKIDAASRLPNWAPDPWIRCRWHDRHRNVWTWTSGVSSDTATTFVTFELVCRASTWKLWSWTDPVRRWRWSWTGRRGRSRSWGRGTSRWLGTCRCNRTVWDCQVVCPGSGQVRWTRSRSSSRKWRRIWDNFHCPRPVSAPGPRSGPPRTASEFWTFFSFFSLSNCTNLIFWKKIWSRHWGGAYGTCNTDGRGERINTKVRDALSRR